MVVNINYISSMKQIKDSPMIELLKKLAIAKAQIGKVKLGGRNPHFKSRYLCLDNILEVIEPVLAENNLLLLQTLFDNKVVTRVYELESGEYLESSIDLIPNNDPQKIGSQITYFKRYQLVAMFSILGSDNDDECILASTPKPITTGLWKSEILPFSQEIAKSLGWSEDQRKAALKDILARMKKQYTDIDVSPSLAFSMKQELKKLK